MSLSPPNVLSHVLHQVSSYTYAIAHRNFFMFFLTAVVSVHIQERSRIELRGYVGRGWRFGDEQNGRW